MNSVSGRLQRRPSPKGANVPPRWYIVWRYKGPAKEEPGVVVWRQTSTALGPAWDGRGRRPKDSLTKKEAERELSEFLVRKRGEPLARAHGGDEVTFGQAVDEWLRWAEGEGNIRPSTLVDYRSIVKAHLRPAFGDMKLTAVTTAVIERWRSQKIREGLSLRSARKLTYTLSGVFRLARRRYGLPSNPVETLEPLKIPYVPRTDHFSIEEVFALGRAAESEDDAALFQTAAFTGLRRGELLALRWRDVDFSGSKLRVERSYSGREIGRPKSGRGREVPMTDEVARALAKLGQREKGSDDDDLVFPGAEGRPQDPDAVSKRYRSARDQAKLRPLNFHDLRHTFATRAAATGKVTLQDLQGWLGHHSITMTEKYAAWIPTKDAARLLSEAFRGGGPVPTEVDSAGPIRQDSG